MVVNARAALVLAVTLFVNEAVSVIGSLVIVVGPAVIVLRGVTSVGTVVVRSG